MSAGTGQPFDLRSDTVTRPSAAMRRAMAEAEVGDDVYREDPTTRRLEERVAELVGTEAALFVPSGTMANQVALLCHCRPGDEVVVGEGTHCAFYESGAAPAWSGVQFQTVGRGGLFGADDVRAGVKPRAYYCPRTSLVVVENTHNRAGGRVFPEADVAAIAATCRELGLALHMDGARLWHAAAATGRPVHALAAPADSVAVAFSKGLGAPVGSALCGSRALVEAALRFRKMLGGGMRQVGILAAGALHALEHHHARLVEDHEAARALGEALAEVPGLGVAPVETNIVMVTVPHDAALFVAAAREAGVLVSAFGPWNLRLVTHLDVSGPRFAACIAALRAAFERELARGGP
ncbi:MAG: aminotransferase class I/II-fold pyridoxal phosphate-dependent enzyme [Myxococcales bacterium]|nr:aminotransferase class I/II-fold pyridoxal phosphate-dependent enzyme [Myxococcales bacterium]